MKKNDFIEIKSLNTEALTEKVRILRGELSDLRIDKGMNKLTDLKVISKKRKDLAKILTVLNQKKLLQKLEDQVNTTKEEVSKKIVKEVKSKTKKEENTK